MSPKSKTQLKSYYDTILKPKESFLIGNDSVLEQDLSSLYYVEKHMIFSVNIIGEVLVCDDKDAVSIIDPNKMKLIAGLQVPKENSYLQSAYFVKDQNIIFLSFD